MRLWIILIPLFLQLRENYGYRILAVVPYSGRSHYLSVQPVFQELANRGHDLTVITTNYEKNPNYKQIILDKKMIWDTMGEKPDIYSMETMSFTQSLNFIWNACAFLTENAFNSTSLKDFVKNDNSHYDLIIYELFYMEAFLMFMHKYNAPAIGMWTMSFGHYIGSMMGNPIILPYMMHEYGSADSTELTFFQRLTNAHHYIYEQYWREKHVIPQHQAIAERIFADLPKPLPRLVDLEKRFSMMFVNGHFTYDVVKPFVPGIVEIGGAHIKKPKSLPQDLKKIIDESEHGVIYFSLGSNIQSKDMLPEKIHMFLNVFRNVKQRVIWKFEDDQLPGKPDNVIIGKWMPQNDILAHPNVKIFITHGGLLSIQESIYHGVPMITFPFYGDQMLNSERVVKAGFGIKLKFKQVTGEILKEAIDEIVNNPKYKQNAAEFSKKFKDRPIPAMDTAIYWIEYVIRHKGAPFMKSPILNLTAFVYYMLDILVFLVVCCVIALTAIVSMFRFVFGTKGKPIRKNDKKTN